MSKSQTLSILQSQIPLLFTYKPLDLSIYSQNILFSEPIVTHIRFQGIRPYRCLISATQLYFSSLTSKATVSVVEFRETSADNIRVRWIWEGRLGWKSWEMEGIFLYRLENGLVKEHVVEMIEPTLPGMSTVGRGWRLWDLGLGVKCKKTRIS